jgi:hypothetical protein
MMSCWAATGTGVVADGVVAFVVVAGVVVAGVVVAAAGARSCARWTGLVAVRHSTMDDKIERHLSVGFNLAFISGVSVRRVEVWQGE